MQPQSTDHSKQLRPPQFGLRSLLLTVFLFACVLAGYRTWRLSCAPASLLRLDDVTTIEVQRPDLSSEWHMLSPEEGNEILMSMRDSRRLTFRGNAKIHLAPEVYRCRVTRNRGQSFEISIRQSSFWMEDERRLYNYRSKETSRRVRVICERGTRIRGQLRTSDKLTPAPTDNP